MKYIFFAHGVVLSPMTNWHIEAKYLRYRMRIKDYDGKYMKKCLWMKGEKENV